MYVILRYKKNCIELFMLPLLICCVADVVIKFFACVIIQLADSFLLLDEPEF